MIVKEQLGQLGGRIEGLEKEIKDKKEQIKAIESKKERYKDAASQCNKEIEQLSKRMREMSG